MIMFLSPRKQAAAKVSGKPAAGAGPGPATPTKVSPNGSSAPVVRAETVQS